MIDIVIDVMFVFITAYVFVVGFLSSWFMVRMRSVIREHRESSELLGQMVSSIYESIDDKEGRIIDLMYRTNLLEATISRGSREDIPGESGVKREFIGRDVRRDVIRTPKGVISEPEQILIKSLVGGPLRVAEITKSMGKSREHTSRMLGKLVRNGVLERRSSVGGITYEITEVGKKLVM